MCIDKINSISQVLVNEDRVQISGDATNIYAAVMMIIRESENSLETLLIRRSTNAQDIFSGHMAFPGGKKKSEDENKLETALRETHEEIGLDLRNRSEILGNLDDCKPSTPAARRFIVRPYVAYIKEEYPLTFNYEVSEAVWIPLNDLKSIYLSNLKKYNGEFIKEAFEYNYKEYFIWGLTGRILNNFFDLTCNVFD